MRVSETNVLCTLYLIIQLLFKKSVALFFQLQCLFRVNTFLRQFFYYYEEENYSDVTSGERTISYSAELQSVCLD